MKKIVFSSVLMLVAVACSQPALNLPADSGKVVGLNSLLTLSEGDNQIYTQDFIPQCQDIDSVTCDFADVQCALSSDKLKLVVTAPKNLPQFVDIQFGYLECLIRCQHANLIKLIMCLPTIHRENRWDVCKLQDK